jgi:hypothetical protein
VLQTFLFARPAKGKSRQVAARLHDTCVLRALVAKTSSEFVVGVMAWGVSDINFEYQQGHN